MSRSGTSRRLPLNGRGATSVEMAMVASAFFLMLLGGLEIGRYFFVSESVKYVVGELARAAVVAPDAGWTSNATKAPYVARSPILRLSDFTTLTVAVTRAMAPAATTVQVTAEYPYNFNLAFLPVSSYTIRSRVRLSFLAPAP